MENTKDKDHKLDKKQMEAIENDLRKKTGLKSIAFDKAGKLTYNKNETPEIGGSAKLRETILGAINDSENTFQIGDYSGSENIQFALTDQGEINQDGITTYQVQIDFSDYANAGMYSDKEALQSTTLGISLHHEFNHKVSYDPSNPLPGAIWPDVSPSAGVPGVIDLDNVVRSQLGLAPRDPGAHAGQPYKGAVSRLKGTYEIPFKNGHKFLRWKRESQRKIQIY